MNKLRNAMENKGWSISETARQTGITGQSIRNLIRQGETRSTHPANVTVYTMVRLMEAFPELEVSDFVSGSFLTVKK